MNRDFKSELITIRDSYTLPEDQVYYDKVDVMISYLDGTSSSKFLKFTFTTFNSYFASYEDLITEITPWAENYKIYSVFTTDIENINLLFDVDLEAIAYDETGLDNFYNDLQASVGYIETFASELESYIARLKKLLSDMKIVAKMLESETPFENSLYLSRSTDSKILIDNLYDIKTNQGQKEYQQRIQTELFDIKIERS